MDPTPRISGKDLRKYVNQRVRLVGKLVEPPRNLECTIQTADNVDVKVRLLQEWSFEGEYVEIIGLINSDFIVEEMTSCSFGSNFDLPAYGKLVELQAKCPEIF